MQYQNTPKFDVNIKYFFFNTDRQFFSVRRFAKKNFYIDQYIKIMPNQGKILSSKMKTNFEQRWGKGNNKHKYL